MASSPGKESNEERMVETEGTEQLVSATIAAEGIAGEDAHRSTPASNIVVPDDNNESSPKPTFRLRRQQSMERRRNDPEDDSTGTSCDGDNTIITTSDADLTFRATPQPGAYPVGGFETTMTAMGNRTAGRRTGLMDDYDDYDLQEDVARESTNAHRSSTDNSVPDDVITATVSLGTATSEDDDNTASKNENQSTTMTNNASTRCYIIVMICFIVVVIGLVTTVSVVFSSNDIPELVENEPSLPSLAQQNGTAAQQAPPGLPVQQQQTTKEDIDYLNEFLSTPFENLDVAAETLTSISFSKHEL